MFAIEQVNDCTRTNTAQREREHKKSSWLGWPSCANYLFYVTHDVVWSNLRKSEDKHKKGILRKTQWTLNLLTYMCVFDKENKI